MADRGGNRRISGVRQRRFDLRHSGYRRRKKHRHPVPETDKLQKNLRHGDRKRRQGLRVHEFLHPGNEDGRDIVLCLFCPPPGGGRIAAAWRKRSKVHAGAAGG